MVILLSFHGLCCRLRTRVGFSQTPLTWHGKRGDEEPIDKPPARRHDPVMVPGQTDSVRDIVSNESYMKVSGTSLTNVIADMMKPSRGESWRVMVTSTTIYTGKRGSILASSRIVEGLSEPHIPCVARSYGVEKPRARPRTKRASRRASKETVTLGTRPR